MIERGLLVGGLRSHSWRLTRGCKAARLHGNHGPESMGEAGLGQRCQGTQPALRGLLPTLDAVWGSWAPSLSLRCDAECSRDGILAGVCSVSSLVSAAASCFAFNSAKGVCLPADKVGWGHMNQPGGSLRFMGCQEGQRAPRGRRVGLGFLRQWQEGELQEPNWGPLSGHKSAQGRPFHTPASAQRQGPMSLAPDGQDFSASSSSSRLLPPAGGPCSGGGGGWRGGLRTEREPRGPSPLTLTPDGARDEFSGNWL